MKVMAESKLVSIIIPVYNAEPYIQQCIDSIRNQSYRKIQLILIDDGSTDGSLQICLNNQSQDFRLEVYHQTNAGPSAARNCGLNHVSGEYLMFVDSDDYLELNTIEILVNEMEEYGVDCCGFGWNEVVNGRLEKEHLYTEQEKNASKEQIIRNIAFNDYLNGGGFLWNKIWRVKSICKTGFQNFDIELKRYEDKLWILQNIIMCYSFRFIDVSLYNYRLIQGSLSHEKSSLQTAKTFQHLL